MSGGGAFHGKSGTKVSYDGMGMENSSGNSSYQLNSASVEEMVMSTSGISADTNADGLVVNIVPKEGEQHVPHDARRPVRERQPREPATSRDELQGARSARRRTRR